MRQKLLLHVCCGPCAAYPADILKEEFNVTFLFYGPNIYPYGEYEKRKEGAKSLAEILSLNFIELEYDPGKWQRLIKGKEDEPEGGERCVICHRMRLRRAARFAALNGYSHLATTLTTSPHKRASVINQAGRTAVENLPVEFMEYDFKKKEGFKKGCLLSREYKLYRQTYCGCQYSMGHSIKSSSKVV